MQACDVVIHPRSIRAFGRTLVEAMLAGVPLIATDTGAASDILEGGKAGTLVKRMMPAGSPPRSPRPRAARSAVGQLAHAQQRARAHYSVERMREAVCGIIGQVMTGRTAVGARA